MKKEDEMMLDLNELELKFRMFYNEFDLSLGEDFEKRWYVFISYLRLFCFEEYVSFIGERPDNHLTFTNTYHAKIFHSYANGVIKRSMRRSGPLKIRKTIWETEEDEYDNITMIFNGKLVTVTTLSFIISQKEEDTEKDKSYIFEALLGLVATTIFANIIAGNGGNYTYSINEQLMIDYKDIIEQTYILNGLDKPNYNNLPLSSLNINKPVPLPLPNDKPKPLVELPEALTSSQAEEEFKLTNETLNGYSAMLDKGGVKKQWITVGDDRVRRSHEDIDGEIVGIDEKFGNGLMFPNDPAGPPQETDNCRCSMEIYGADGETVYE